MILLKGKPASPGIAIGKIFVYRAFQSNVFKTYFEEREKEAQLQRMNDAFEEAKRELTAIVDAFQSANNSQAAIFEAHLEVLEDEELINGVREAIEEKLVMPDYAVDKTFHTFVKMLEEVKDPLIAARIADLRDVRNRLIRILHGEKENNLSFLTENVIVVAHDLLPSDTATLDKEKVLGIVTEVGSSTSHSAIIARAYGIPAVQGLRSASSILHDGDFCIVDANNGTVYENPDDETLQKFVVERDRYQKEAAEIQSYLKKDAVLKDGERILVGLNVGATEPNEYYPYCDFIGLLRSEFIYMQSDHMPTEEEQFEAYVEVLKNAKGRPVTLRTLDIGGDKTLKYMSLPVEDNPFLGKRALRLCLDNPDMFNTQLRAALRASAYGKLWLMFPMVGSIDDIRAGRAALERAKAELREEGAAFDENLKVGIMIEIPSIAEIADLAVKEVDFASIGSNDLTQYLFACDRMNAEISDYYQSRSPAMFRTMGRIIRTFNEAGKDISICGEMGGDPLSAIVLVGLGMHKLSMVGASIPRVKRALSKFTLKEAQEIAANVVNLSTQAEIDAYLKQQIDSRA